MNENQGSRNFIKWGEFFVFKTFFKESFLLTIMNVILDIWNFEELKPSVLL